MEMATTKRIEKIVNRIRELTAAGWEYPEAEWEATKDMNLPLNQIETIRWAYLDDE